MSVGHVARVFEAAGIATVVIAVAAFGFRMGKMMAPRVVRTPHPLGRPLGAPGDSDRQRHTVLSALKLLENAAGAGSVFDLPGSYAAQHSNDIVEALIG